MSDPDDKPPGGATRGALPSGTPPGASGTDEVALEPEHQRLMDRAMSVGSQPGPASVAEKKPATAVGRHIEPHDDDDDDERPSEAEVATETPRREPWRFALRREPTILWRVFLGGAFILFALGAWYILTAGEIVEERIFAPHELPQLGDVLASFPGLVEDRALFQSIASTLTRVFLGFGLAIIVGVPLGILAAAWRPLHAFMAPLVLFGRNIPIAVLIPLSMLMFGIDEGQKIIFIFTACVPFVFSDAAAAVMGIHQRYVETAQTLGASSPQIIRKVLVPLALPEIYTGLRYLFGLAFGYIMLAELVNAEHGLGHLISISQRRSATADIFMILFIITALAFAIDRLLAFFQKGLFPYRNDA